MFCITMPPTFKVGDIAGMEALEKGALSQSQRIEINFALGKAYSDLGEERRGFEHLVKGNNLKRSQVRYDEAASQRFFDHVMDVFSPELLKKKAKLGDPSLGVQSSFHRRGSFSWGACSNRFVSNPIPA